MGSLLSALVESEPAIPPLDDPAEDEPCALLITGVCDSWSQPRFLRFLSRLSLPYASVTKRRGEDFAVIKFANNEDRRTVYNYLAGCQLSETAFTVKPFVDYDPPPMPFATQAEILKFSGLKRPTIHERLFPLGEVTKEERIKTKKANVAEFTKEVVEGELVFHEMPENAKQHVCVELLVGFDEEGNVTVGFNSGSRTNVTLVAVDETFHLPERVVNVAREFADFADKSLFPPFDSNSDTGKWKALVMRHTSAGELMMVVVTFGGLPLFELQRLVETFTGKVDSLHWVKGERSTFDVHSPNRVIHGANFLTETIGELKFSIQPFSKFPSNLTAYAQMMARIGDMAKLDSDTVFVDVACGIGTACLLVAAKTKRTVGIDQDEHMVNGAMKNTEMSEVKNAFFARGTCEQILLDVVNNISANERIVCFMDTMNAGPHVQDMKAVRKCARVKTFVYVTESPYTFSYDCQRLLVSGKEEGAPFTLDSVELFDFAETLPAVTMVGVFTRDTD